MIKNNTNKKNFGVANRMISNDLKPLILNDEIDKPL